MRPASPRTARLLVACSLLLSTPDALGSPLTSPTVEAPLAESLTGGAKAAFDAANVLVANKDFAGAAIKFHVAFALSKDPRLLFSVAICEKNLRHYVAMRALLEQYVRESGPRLTPESRASVEQALAASRDFVGTLRVSSSEGGATVEIDGDSVGTTPLGAAIPLDLGVHSIVIRKEGFASFERTVTVVGGNEISVSAALVRVATGVKGGHLVVHVAPTVAVTVDNDTSMGGFDGPLASGSHEVRATEQGKVPRALTIELHDGETQTFDLTLDAEARQRALWPWLVGGGAVVVAGAVVAGYLASRSSSDTLTTPEGQASLGTFHLSSLRR